MHSKSIKTPFRIDGIYVYWPNKEDDLGHSEILKSKRTLQNIFKKGKEISLMYHIFLFKEVDLVFWSLNSPKEYQLDYFTTEGNILNIADNNRIHQGGIAGAGKLITDIKEDSCHFVDNETKHFCMFERDGMQMLFFLSAEKRNLKYRFIPWLT